MSNEEFRVYSDKCKEVIDKEEAFTACSLINKLAQYVPDDEEGMDFLISLNDEEAGMLIAFKELDKMWD